MRKIGQSGGFLSRVLRPWLETGSRLIKNVLKPLDKSFLMPLRLTAAVSAKEVAIHKKLFGSGTRSSDFTSRKTTLIISNEEINGIMKIVESLEESGLLIKGVSERIKNEAKEEKRWISQYIIRNIMC